MGDERPILIVDDEADLLNLVDMNLRREGFKTATAMNGRDALEVARRERPQLVVLDLMLPDLSGTEVCRRIRADPDLADTAIIMLSAKGEEIDRVVGFEVGADDYVVKPFSVRELTLRIKARNYALQNIGLWRFNFLQSRYKNRDISIGFVSVFTQVSSKCPGAGLAIK